MDSSSGSNCHPQLSLLLALNLLWDFANFLRLNIEKMTKEKPIKNNERGHRIHVNFLYFKDLSRSLKEQVFSQDFFFFFNFFKVIHATKSEPTWNCRVEKIFKLFHWRQVNKTSETPCRRVVLCLKDGTTRKYLIFYSVRGIPGMLLVNESWGQDKKLEFTLLD